MPATALAGIGLIVAAAPVTSAQQAAETVPIVKKVTEAHKVTEAPDAPQRQGFSIVLLLGDMQGASAEEGLPAAAARALADMKDFLPYKSYRLLDTQWTLCCSGSAPAITRLRGVDEQEYELELRSVLDPSGRLQVRFFLREPRYGADGLSTKQEPEPLRQQLAKQGMIAAAEAQRRNAETAREIFTLERERLDLEAQLQALRQQVEAGVKDKADLPRLSRQLEAVTSRIRDLKKDLNTTSQLMADGRTVIDTSFHMTLGETVVVGTSRLKGGSRALIALLTAVPKPKTRLTK
jgi:hypothetical protein